MHSYLKTESSKGPETNKKVVVPVRFPLKGSNRVSTLAEKGTCPTDLMPRTEYFGVADGSETNITLFWFD